MLKPIIKILLAIVIVLFVTQFCHAQKIVIDIGHTPGKPGAIGATGRAEYEYNTNMAFFLKNRLRERGYNVVIVRDIERLQSRAGKIDGHLPDVTLSIHHDSVQPKYLTGSWIYGDEAYRYTDDIKGYSLFVNSERPSSVKLATLIGRNLQKADFVPSKHHAEKIQGEGREPLDSVLGIYQFNELVILKNVHRGAVVLIECGVITNRYEVFFISDARVMLKMSGAITKAVDEYFGK